MDRGPVRARRWSTGLVAAVAVAAIAAPTSLAVGSPAAEAATTGSTRAAASMSSASALVSPATYDARVRTLTNAERSKKHLHTLAKGTCIKRYAIAWAKHMASTRRLVHQKLMPILKACGLTWVGENIAYGYQTPKSVVVAWMHSTGHRENILRPQFRRISVGAAKDKNGVYWVSQVFSRPN